MTNTPPFIGSDTVGATLTWSAAVDALIAGHRRPRADIADTLVALSAGELLTRTAAIDGLGFGVKSVSIFPGNPEKAPPRPTVQGAFLLFDAADGDLKAMIDGALLTRWKTAADSVLGARLLAKPNPRRLVVMGAGPMAAALIEAYADQFPSLDHISVWARRPDAARDLADAARAFLSKIRDRGPIEIVTATALADHVALADVICAATAATSPVLHGRWIRRGAHVDLIGAHGPLMREADDDLMIKARIFVDSKDSTIDHIGELAIPIASGALTRDAVLGDLYDLVPGGSGHRGANDITVFKNGGGAHLDLMIADLIARLHTRPNVLEPPEK